MSISGDGDIWVVVFTLERRPNRGDIKARSRDAHQAAVESDLSIKKSHQLKLNKAFNIGFCQE
jgi:hypothetical protein